MLDASTQQAYRALAEWVANRVRQHGACPVIGINGAQGSGKSTLGRVGDTLQSVHGLHAALLSIDDFYLPRAAREQLAQTVHPLFATRGVPGTHEVALGRSRLQQLRTAAPGQRVLLPRFSKAADDRLAESDWPAATGRFDLVLFEGWCVGLPPQAEDALAAPINELEAHDDADGRWRRRVNEHLRHEYAAWFAQLDRLVFLQVPDFDSVRRWRWQQECETAAAHGPGPARGLMSQPQLDRFLQHYERLTRHALQQLPAQAEALLVLDRDHAVTSLRLA
ncbi:MAG: kinase [Nevskia sp.]